MKSEVGIRSVQKYCQMAGARMVQCRNELSPLEKYKQPERPVSPAEAVEEGWVLGGLELAGRGKMIY